MTLAGRPCSIAISNANRSASRAAAGSIRASSTTRSVSCAFRAKCLTVAMTWRLCTPATAFPAMSPVSSGSSEKYSKLRPPRGSRIRSAAPPSSTEKPLPRASAPTASPCRRAKSGSQLEASARSEGIAVAVSPDRMKPGFATPSSASVSCRGGMPSRGMPGTKPAEPIAPGGFGFPPQGAPRPPWTRESSSSRVICSTAIRARSSAGRERLSQGHPSALAAWARRTDSTTAKQQSTPKQAFRKKRRR